MKRGPAGEVLRCYSASPIVVRLHAALRLWGCPVHEVERRVPLQGRVLEVGCSIGVTSIAMAAASPHRQVLGLDIDARKVAAARQAASSLPPGRGTAAFEVVRAGTDLSLADAAGTAIPAGTTIPTGFVAAVFSDVLYLMERGMRDRWLEGAARLLAPGGVLVVKEVARRPRWKYACIKTQDRVLTDLLGVNEGTTVDYSLPDEIEAMMAGAGLDVIESLRVDQGYAYPHHVVVGQKPSGVAGAVVGEG